MIRSARLTDFIWCDQIIEVFSSSASKEAPTQAEVDDYIKEIVLEMSPYLRPESLRLHFFVDSDSFLTQASSSHT